MTSLVPCPTCPYRRSSPVGGCDIPGFSLAKMRELKDCVGDGDAFRKVMACHYSPEGEEYPCIGYVATDGIHNLQIRIMASAGEVNYPAIRDACEGLDLWPSFDEMLAAYEAVIAAGITCPTCGLTSHHPKDIAEGYCGHCHDWTGQGATT